MNVIVMTTIVAVAGFLGKTQTLPCRKLQYTFDLSYSYNNKTIYWPTELSERFQFTKRYASDTGGSHYEANSFTTAEHGGTHLDAPRHFYKGGKGVGDIPVTDLIGESIVVDVQDKTSSNADYLVSESDFEKWERTHGKIQDKTIVLLRTGWGKRWPNASRYLGTATTNVSLLHFPGLSEAGAKWLADERKIKAVGIDTASIDFGQSTTFKSHTYLASKGILIFENVANMDKLPVKNFLVFALPMKIGEGSGAPLRIIATWDDVVSKASLLSPCTWIMSILLIFIIPAFS